jgi:hypothetical protein
MAARISFVGIMFELPSVIREERCRPMVSFRTSGKTAILHHCPTYMEK